MSAVRQLNRNLQLGFQIINLQDSPITKFTGTEYMTNLAQSPSRENTLAEVKQQYEAFKAKGLKLNLTRGKPAPAQLPQERLETGV